MTRAVPPQPSPQFSSFEMFTGAIQASAINSPGFPSESQNTSTGNTAKVKRPPFSKMIDEAIFEKHKGRKGTSLIAIKKYLQENYHVDVKKTANRNRICKYIRESVGSGGHLKQMTGRGAQGSFTLTYNARKKFKVKKEKSITIKNQFEDSKNIPRAKIKSQKHRVDNDLYETPVTRMRVKQSIL